MEKDQNVSMQPVQSSNLAAIGYASASRVLYVEFKNGVLYGYRNVPEKTYQELMSAESLGKFFHAKIRNDFPYEKITT